MRLRRTGDSYSDLVQRLVRLGIPIRRDDHPPKRRLPGAFFDVAIRRPTVWEVLAVAEPSVTCHASSTIDASSTAAAFTAPSACGTIPFVRMPFEPMLATNRVSRPLAGTWVLEPKFDGWRAIVAVGEDVRVWTRTGHELTDRLPELAPIVDYCGGATVVLDGELVAGQGRAADFYGLLPRVAAHRRREPLTFVAFDVLAFDGPVIDQPYCRRRALLDRLALHGPAWCTVPQLHGTVTEALDACAEHDVEGIVAKRSESPYRPGERSGDWLKVKTADWRAAHAARRHRR